MELKAAPEMTPDISEPALHDGEQTSAIAEQRLATRYDEIRRRTTSLCAPLEIEDYVVQSMPDASPAKWHLAHTSWFFETFVLKAAFADEAVSKDYAYLFNSYYNAVGERTPRAERGLISRPTVAEVYRYREAVDERMRALLESAEEPLLRRLGATIELGLNHEQQHQELILTDLKFMFGRNPLRPAYREPRLSGGTEVPPVRWLRFAEGLRQVGHDGNGFAFDNELPRHSVFVQSFQLADRLVTNEEFRAFVDDGGYDKPRFWLSDGWNARNSHGWTAPLYWEQTEGRQWRIMTLAGLRDLEPNEPVCHVSYYEADAYARWADARLPSEAEWEVATEGVEVQGNFLEDEYFHPQPLAVASAEGRLSQLFGDVWEWTRSPYCPYPGYRPAAGALGEYNGKFMCNQMVLRGGSCVTPRSHIRSTYRNFFPPEARWQFSGIRLANDA
ncbi:ergothioneine biosynthesis protein EgtB [Singulisphaera acidiphila]|uniref:TIGR03440 family protein n=1 Tax=Singulisphaera acidiphila (strain ATCC BAA-1392 / DSM 18658 / VKM B-2454 / MOB10) TaxID=886293 RepID=L0D9H1_SINAD|nr:ergothioneine biosynthesis protein EgtB [Singulisphaera acidiphila]AGA25515.1 TIGR03440 family protein [Singulisphaera acidiphila DSM 18658]